MELLKREEAKTDFAKYCEYVGKVIPARHHQIICKAIQDVLDGKNKRLIINAPPGSAKSTYTSLLLPSFSLGYKGKYKLIGGSHTQELAEDFSKKVRNQISTQEYQNVFPNVQVSPDSRAAQRWSTTAEGSYLASGVGAGIAGYRANGLLIDDPYRTKEDARSETIRKKTIDWFYNDAKTRLFPGGWVILIQTRWHPEDLAGHLIAKSEAGTGDKYEVISLQAIYENDRIPDPIGRKVGEALWPEWQPLQELLDIKRDMETLDWLALYQQEPTNPSGNVIDITWFSEYESLKMSDLQNMMIVVSWDTAGVVNDKADYTVGLVFAINPQGQMFLLDMYRKQADFPTLEKEVYSFSKQWNANFVLIEDRGTGTSLLQKYKKKPINSIAISPAAIGDKEFRFDKASSSLEAGKMFLPKHATFKQDFLSEMLQFPYGRFRDTCDAWSQMINWYESRTIKRGTVKMNQGKR